MAIRAGMVDLIDRLRSMIGDPVGDGQRYDPEDLQREADLHRREVRYQPLLEVEQFFHGGTVNYFDFYASEGQWEGTAGLLFMDATYGTILPTVANSLEGKWHFGTAPLRPVMITGYVYDLEAAAADLLEQWAAFVKRCIDFADGDQKFSLSQQFANIMTLADRYNRQAEPISVSMWRSDVEHERVKKRGPVRP